MAILVEQVFANLTFADLEDGDGTVRQESVNVDEEEVVDEFYVRWIAPESTAERKLWPGPNLVDKCTVKLNEETVGAEVRDAEVENVGLHQPNVSSPAPACEAASMDASPPCHGNMQKVASNTTSPAANMDDTFNPSSDVPVTLSNSNVPSVFEETVNMQVGAGGSNMVAAFTGLKRR
nr:hypothetical protein Iba_chr14bCG9630 [Ipomoea batatas]